MVLELSRSPRTSTPTAKTRRRWRCCAESTTGHPRMPGIAREQDGISEAAAGRARARRVPLVLAPRVGRGPDQAGASCSRGGCQAMNQLGGIQTGRLLHHHRPASQRRAVPRASRSRWAAPSTPCYPSAPSSRPSSRTGTAAGVPKMLGRGGGLPRARHLDDAHRRPAQPPRRPAQARPPRPAPPRRPRAAQRSPFLLLLLRVRAGDHRGRTGNCVPWVLRLPRGPAAYTCEPRQVPPPRASRPAGCVPPCSIHSLAWRG